MILRLSLQQSLHEKQGKILRVSEIQDDNLILVGEGTRFTLLSLSTQNEWSRVIARSDECSSLSMPQMLASLYLLEPSLLWMRVMLSPLSMILKGVNQ